MKNKLCQYCTVCSAVAGIVGFILLGQAAWQWVDGNLANTVKLMIKLF